MGEQEFEWLPRMSTEREGRGADEKASGKGED